MKRVVMTVLVVVGGISIGGCQDGPDEVEGSVAEEMVVPEPLVSDSSEAIGPDVSRGLVGWWKFDESSGARAADSSDRGRAGTLRGGLSFDSNSVEGRTGKALRFEGGDDYVEVVGYKGITGTQPRTVAAWVKTKKPDGEIASWGRDEGGGMFIFGHVEGRRRIGVTPQGGYLYMNKKTNDDAWYHVAAVVEEAELPNLHDHIKIFLDGEVAVIHDIGILDLWPIDTPAELDVRIGQGLEGALDDVRIYERALSEDEIRLLFDAK